MKQNLITLILFGIIVILLGIIVFLLANYNTDNTNYNQSNTQVELQNEVVNNSVIANLPEGIIEIDYKNVTNENKVSNNKTYGKPGLQLAGIIYTETSKNETSEFDINKVTITIKEESITSTSMDIIIANRNERIISMSSKFVQIQKYINGEWVEIGAIPPMGEEDDSIEIYKLQTILVHVDWEKYYGKLETGKYKANFIIKNQIVSAEFDIKQEY